MLLCAELTVPLFSPKLRNPFQARILTAQVLAFLGCESLCFQVVLPHMKQDLTKAVGASWLPAALAETQLTVDSLICAW